MLKFLPSLLDLFSLNCLIYFISNPICNNLFHIQPYHLWRSKRCTPWFSLTFFGASHVITGPPDYFFISSTSCYGLWLLQTIIYQSYVRWPLICFCNFKLSDKSIVKGCSHIQLSSISFFQTPLPSPYVINCNICILHIL